MTTTLHSATKPRRLVSVLIAAMFGLTLAVNPAAAPEAEALVSATNAARATRVAAAQIGIRYVYGGTTRAGFDCSGLTQYAYARVGKRLPRTAQQQFKATYHPRAQHRRVGDLVFFYSGWNVYHMGIYAGNGYMIHSPRAGKRVQKVRIWTSHVLYGRVR